MYQLCEMHYVILSTIQCRKYYTFLHRNTQDIPNELIMHYLEDCDYFLQLIHFSTY